MNLKIYLSKHGTTLFKKFQKGIFTLGIILFITSTSAFINKANAQTGEVLNFDGVDDNVTLPFVLNKSYTKEAWINPTTVAGFPNILSGSNSALYINNNLLTAGHTFPWTNVQDVTPIVTGVWTHVAVTYNDTTQVMVLYKNGVAVSTATGVAPSTDFISFIGTLNQPSTFFSGNIDEVRYWNLVRTPTQLAANMSCNLTGDEFGLYAYYKFNQGIAGGNNIAITSLTDSQDKCPSFSNTILNGFALTGSTSNFVAGGPTLTAPCSGEFPNISISGNSNCILLGDISPSTADFTNFGDFGYNPIAKTFVITNTGGATLNISSVVISGTDAADFVLTTPPATTVAANGSTSFTITFNPSAPIGVRTATVTVNSDDLDEAAYDFSISANNAGEAKSLNFDGTDDRVDLPFLLTGSYTKEAWVNADAFISASNILSGTSNAFYAPNGNLSAGHVFPFTTVQDPAVMIAGTWYHVAVTYDSVTKEMKLYKNGIQVGTTAVDIAYAPTQLSIGAYEGDFEWGGFIDEVRIWKMPRTAAEILANMNCQLTGDEPGLIAYYDFNQGAASGNNEDITVLKNKADRCENYDGILQNFDLTTVPSNFSILSPLGTAVCAGTYENISIIGNGNCIQDGNTTPSVANDTDFGASAFPAVFKTYTIVNSGDGVLNISSIVISGTNASNFTLVGIVPTTVAANSSVSFTIEFQATGSGQRNATVTINNSDADESSYSFAITGEATLVTPIQLISFNGYLQGKNVNLQWKTATEINSGGFTIERATNVNGPWQQIAQVTSTNQLNGDQYNYMDASLASGVYVYRLKQLDTDGSYTYSKVLVFNLNNGRTSISIFPNPVKDVVNIYTYDQNLLKTNYQVSAIDGKIMLSGTIRGTQTTVDCSNWTPGIYVVKFSNGSVERIIKQ